MVTEAAPVPVPLALSVAVTVHVNVSPGVASALDSVTEALELTVVLPFVQA